MVQGMLMKADGTIQFREVRDELDEWYTLLGCSLIETVQIYIGKGNGTRATVICDGEALLNGNDTPMIFGREKDDASEYPIIVGNIFVCKTEGDSFSELRPEDVFALMSSVGVVRREDGSLRPVLTGAHRFKL